MEKVYLYLLRRDKKDIKVVGSLQSGSHVHATRINDLDMLGLPVSERSDLKDVVKKHQKDWEAWIESAETYDALKSNLYKRGCVVPSSSNTPLIKLESFEIPKSSLIKLGKNKVMIRRMN